MQEVKITKAILNERRELQVNLLIKEWDYSDTEAELLRQSKINWDLLDLKFIWLAKEDPNKNRKENLQKLATLMSVYCDKLNYNLEWEKGLLYKRNNVKSRSDLTNSQIDSEIELYYNWINYM